MIRARTARLLRAPLLFCATVAAAAGPFAGSDFGKVTRHEVADGVHLFTTTGYGDVGMCGNVVAVVTAEGVVVFDSGAVPSTAEAILAEIRKLTPQPVRYLVNSHWHWDHWGGNQVFKDASPDLQVVTHEKTREQMLTVEPRWNEDGLNVQLPRHLASLESRLRRAKEAGAAESEVRDLTELLAADRDFLEQKSTLRRTVPDLTFADALTLRLGGREIRVLHARGITIGDTFVFMPGEKILITGDLVVNPVPFAIGGSYPADWVETLERLGSLGPAVIIPGHGNARRDAGLLQGHLALFREVIRRVKDARARGLTAQQAKDLIRSDARALAALLGVHDERTVASFPASFLDTFVSRSFEEQDHPLGDLPAGIRAPR